MNNNLVVSRYGQVPMWLVGLLWCIRLGSCSAARTQAERLPARRPAPPPPSLALHPSCLPAAAVSVTLQVNAPFLRPTLTLEMSLKPKKKISSSVQIKICSLSWENLSKNNFA